MADGEVHDLVEGLLDTAARGEHGKLFVKGKYRMALDVRNGHFRRQLAAGPFLVKTDVVDGKLLGGLGAQGFDAAHIHLEERLHLLRC